MNIHDYKLSLIRQLKERNIFTEQVSGIQIRTRCPYCGDSSKNPHTGHFYLRINPDDNLPIVYNCFKCPASGVATYQTLEDLGLQGTEHHDGIGFINQNASKLNKEDYIKKEVFFQYKLPENHHYDKIKYLENRLGYQFNDEELKEMRVITCLGDFLLANDIHTITCKPAMARYLHNNYIGFLSNNGAYILFRDITDKSEIRWFKYPITQESYGQKIIYSIQSNVDLYTQDNITINLSEGIMDCISVAYNLSQQKRDNVLNLAVCGKYYNTTIEYLLGLGFIGSNVTLNIYPDRDYTHDTTKEYYAEELKKYSYLVGGIYLHYNTKKKDCGVRKEDILLETFKI